MEEMIKGKKGKKLTIFAWFIIGILVGGGAFFAYNKYMVKNNPSSVSQTDQAAIKDLIAKASKLIILPTGEDPVVATITDAAALIKDQVFYKGSINGDVVLVYQKAAKAIVYSPTRNLIVNVGPVVLQDQSQTANNASGASQTPVSTATATTTKNK